jgi:Flp pilus assembly protein TadG
MKEWIRSRAASADEHGSVLVLVAFGIVGLAGMAALAIDLGVMLTAHSEAQRAAESGAHAGAGALVLAPSDEDGARAQARLFAEQNSIRDVTVTVLDEDIDVVLAEQLVRVRVRASRARGNAVPTIFARVLGIDDVQIEAVAAAQAWPAGGVNCILPFIVPDRWSKTPTTPYVWPTMSDTYDPDADHFYKPWSFGGVDDPSVPPTGYGTPDRGTRIQLTTGNPGQAPRPGWYYAIALPGAVGAADYRAAIRGCWDADAVYEPGMTVDKEPGNMQGPTVQGFRDLIAQDPNAVWNSSANDGDGCVTSAGSDLCRGSPRIRPVAMLNPTDWPSIPNGRAEVTISNFAGVFVESSSGGSTWVRFMEFTGVGPSSTWSPTSPLPKVLRIVE